MAADRVGADCADPGHATPTTLTVLALAAGPALTVLTLAVQSVLTLPVLILTVLTLAA